MIECSRLMVVFVILGFCHLQYETAFTGVGSGGARGAAAPLNAGRRGLRPPTNLHRKQGVK